MFSEMAEKITNLEKKYDVDSIQLKDGTRIWNLIRILFYYYSINTSIIQDEERNVVKKTLFLLKESLTSKKIPPNITLCAVSDVDAQKKYQEMYYDSIIDPLEEIFDDFYVFDWPSQKGIRHKNTLKNHIPLNIPLSIIIEKIKPSKQIIHNEILLMKIIDEFSSYFDIDFEKLRRHVYESIGIFVALKKHVKRTFEKRSPSLVFVRAAHGRFQMAVVQACRELHIKTIELQHGLIFDDHIGYLKRTRSSNRDCLPDEVYTWGAFFSDIIKKGYLFPETAIHEVGFPFMEKMVNQPPPQDEQAKGFSKKFNSTVLVAGQAIGDIDSFIKMASVLDETIGYIYKPHPRDIKEYRFSEKNIMVSDRKINYYSLLPCVDVNMGVCSATMFDSICFGVPNIIVYNRDANVSGVADIVDNEVSYLVKQPEELPDIIKRIKKIPKTTVMEKSKIYFKNNSLQEIKKLVDDAIIQKR